MRLRDCYNESNRSARRDVGVTRCAGNMMWGLHGVGVIRGVGEKVWNSQRRG